MTTAIAMNLPVRTRRANGGSHLDRLMPEWHFDETHSIHVAAAPDAVYRAARAVTAEEIPLFRIFTTIRRGGCAHPAGILDPPPDRPILEVATSTTFAMLAEAPPHEMVIGTAVVKPDVSKPRPLEEMFGASIPAGFTLAAMNFAIDAEGARGTRLTTTTRVRASGEHEKRNFAVYWRAIHPGSDILRRTWLQAIRRRAEGR